METSNNRLYIIGNGFDLHHGMRTSYYDFAEYLRKNDRTFYDFLESYIKYPKTDKDPWYRFEENLALLDIDAILDDNEDLLPDILSESYRDRDKYLFPDEMHNNLITLTDGLIGAFTRFIQEVQIPKSAEELKLDINLHSKYLTFNFTYTLEDLYKINPENILHIHNAAESRYSDIILGHGMHPDKLIKRYEYNVEEFPPREEGKIILLDFLPIMFKNTKKIIKENESFFNNLNKINKVYILGHSLSEIDIEYIIKIFFL